MMFEIIKKQLKKISKVRKSWQRFGSYEINDDDDSWPFIAFWIVRLLYKISIFVVHIIFSAIYWGKGKSVPPIKNDLLLLSATELAEKIRDGELTSEKVINAYIERIKEVNSYINALVENRFEEALKEAKKSDDMVKSGTYTNEWLKKEKPLLGVPVTIKVLFKVKGCYSSGAMTLFKDIIATEDAPAVELLKAAGAIILGTTNSPENGLGYDSVNKLYGMTLNPYDLHRTPGGSSGGESALISSAGSVVGMGNDVAGSVRIPAHFTGIFAHKPSRGLVPNTGSLPPVPEGTLQYLAAGPMCRYAEDLATVMEVLTSKNGERMNFNKPVNFKKMKIYYQTKMYNPLMENLDKETMSSVKKAIEHFTQNYGATAEEVDIKMDLVLNMVHNMLAESCKPLVFNTTMGKVSDINVPLEMLKYFIGKSYFAFWAIFSFGHVRNPLLYKEIYMPFYRKLERKLYQDFEKILDENSIFICPTMPFSAPHPYEMISFLSNGIWTALFSVLGFPATQCPVGLNRFGMPHGFQIVTAMNNDHLSIACAKELSKVFGGWIAPS